MPALTATLNTMVDAWKGLGTYIGLATGNPGLTTTAANEVTGGSPAYARVATTWGSSSGGVVTGTAVTINVPASTTVTYAFLANTLSGNDQKSNTTITSTAFSTQGTLVVTPTLTVA